MNLRDLLPGRNRPEPPSEPRCPHTRPGDEDPTGCIDCLLDDLLEACRPMTALPSPLGR